MTSTRWWRRGLAAAAATALAAATLPLLATSASATTTYSLNGPSTIVAGSPVTMSVYAQDQGASAGGLWPAAPGYYCLASSYGTPDLTVNAAQVTDPFQTQLQFPNVTFSGSGDTEVDVFPVNSAGPCPGDPPLGANILTSKYFYVTSGGATQISLTPAFNQSSVNVPVSITWTVSDSTGLPVPLGPGQSITVVANRSTVLFNGSVTTLTISPGYPNTFTVQNSVAQSASITATLNGAGTPQPKDTVSLSTIASGALTVSPATATTPTGGSTGLTVTYINSGGYPVSGIPVTVSSTGRNTFGATSAGSTNANGQVYWVQKDTAAATSTATQDYVTFSAAGLTAAATITYIGGKLTVAPASASANFGGSTSLTVSLVNGANQPLANVPVTVSVTGRNPLAKTSAGATNANGQVVWVQKDTAAATNPSNQDVLTFTANGLAASATITYVAAPPPPAPTGVTAAAGNESATVSWNPPTIPAGTAPVSSYTVQQSTNGGGTWSNSGTTAGTSLVVNGLDNGVPVTFRVAATNSAGMGSFSAPSVPVTPQNPITEPGQVRSLKAVSNNRGKATVSWKPPSSGSPVTTYKYRWKKGNGNYTSWRSTKSLSVKFNNLTPGKQYTWQVKGLNKAGPGPVDSVSRVIAT
ncbi:MAG: fibronectin type III domain-containing protein [Candidatus Nanopelagicales bacterium]